MGQGIDTQKAILDRLRRRPALHVLYAGVYLQSPVLVSDEILIIPFRPLGKAVEGHYLADFVRLIGAEVSEPDVSKLVAQGAEQRPVTILTITSVDLEGTSLSSAVKKPLLTHIESVIAWATGNTPLPFATVLASGDGISCGLTHAGEQSRRTRLGFGNTGQEFTSQVAAFLTASEEDEHFAFALSLHRDAVREANLFFKAARYFTCLEALAYRLKGGEVGSKEAVRRLLGSDFSYMMQVEIEGKPVQVDTVEICGRIRDKLFHGVPFREEDLKRDLREYFRIIERDPSELVGQIEAFCEVHLARWANKKSAGQI
jgi:hypothetical protein